MFLFYIHLTKNITEPRMKSGIFTVNYLNFKLYLIKKKEKTLKIMIKYHQNYNSFLLFFDF